MNKDEFHIVQNGQVGWAMACSRRGSSHIRKGQVCQDAFGLWMISNEGKPVILAAVADGHGHSKHDLSHVGATLAVTAAAQTLSASIALPNFNGVDSEFITYFETEFFRRMHKIWRQMVIKDALIRIGKDCCDHGDYKVLVRYGTTLSLSMLYEGKIALGNLGDSQIVTVESDGKTRNVFTRDPNLVGCETYSMISHDAVTHWQTEILDRNSVSYMMLTSDGIPDSYWDDEQGFYDFINGIIDLIGRYGINKIGEQLPGWLDELSKDGASKDDVTMLLVGLEVPQAPTEDEEKEEEAAQEVPANGSEGATSSEPSEETEPSEPLRKEVESDSLSDRDANTDYSARESTTEERRTDNRSAGEESSSLESERID